MSAAVSTTYRFNDANQRVVATDADGKYWSYDYDPLGQVTSGRKKLQDGTPLLGHDLNYGFDTIGNRTTSTANNSLTTYAPDPAGLNQYPSRTVPSAFDITGTADPAANVFINFIPADRQSDLFHLQLTFNNADAPAWQPVTVVASRPGAGTAGADAIQKRRGDVFVPRTPESFEYDFDGNLESDGRWRYTWDAENRLASMETQAAAVTAGVTKQKLEFGYDAQGRRFQKKVSNWNGTAYVVASDTRFAYNGWNMLAELNGLAGNAVVQTYVWGLDLSGSSQGAGGVGGLLAIGNASATYAPTFDGNGNIVSLINAADGTTSAEYAYGPFGEVIKAAGAAVAANPFGFSTKYTDDETGLLYYGFRYYNASTGRWLSRDPIGEKGGANLYGMVKNDPTNNWDKLGLYPGVRGHGRAIPPDESVAILRNMTASGGSLRDRLSNIIPVQPIPVRNKLNTNAGNRFVYTCKNGWVDMGHFFRNALLVQYLSKDNTEMLATGLENFQVEKGSNSAYSVEDLLSNYLGREFGEMLGKDPAADIADKWEQFLRDSGAVRWDEVSTPLLVDDQISYQKTVPRPEGRSWEQGLNWQRSRPLWKCLCDGDRPKHPNHRF